MCDLVLVLNDGTRVIGKHEIEKYLHLFPPGIVERMRPIVEMARAKTSEGKRSEVRVFQDGTYEEMIDAPQFKMGYFY